MSRTALAALTALAWTLIPACTDPQLGGAVLPELTLTAATPRILVPGTRLTLTGAGFVPPDLATFTVTLEGTLDTTSVAFAVIPERVSETTLEIPIGGQVAQALIRPEHPFTGRISLTRTPAAGLATPEETRHLDLTFTSALTLTPTVTALTPATLFVEDTLTVEGSNFLYPSEGTTLIELSGTMSTTFPVRFVSIDGLVLPGLLAPPDPANPDSARSRLTALLTPDVLGIVPGTFDGTLRVINTALDGTVTTSASLPVRRDLMPPVIEAVTPAAASRGQWIHFSGRGLTAADGLLQAATLIVLEGEFIARDGTRLALTGPSALTLLPDDQPDNTRMSTVLRVTPDGGGGVTGLGARAGTFTGTITPVLLLGEDVVRGQGITTTFTILPQRQIVYLRALPAFDDALAEFGLLAEKAALQARILEVVTRDYAGVNIAFTWEEPQDYAEFSVVELAGRDPNGTGLFGLDNTEGKDLNNLRFNDIIGGYNADTSADGYAAYGGIFPAEFLNFSTRSGDNPFASPRFDDVFEAVIPVLGGRPAEPGESGVSNARGAAIREAIRVFGNLIGSTVSHEVGHSLGLANLDGQFHNIGDNPGWLMDSGSNRPFEERAELDGQGPSFFEEASLTYLKTILPLEGAP